MVLFDYASRLYYMGCESLDALQNMDIEQILLLGMWSELYEIRKARIMGFLLPAGYKADSSTKGSSPNSGHPTNDRWRSGQWQENIGGNKFRVKTRVNIMDLWDNPNLLNQALDPK